MSEIKLQRWKEGPFKAAVSRAVGEIPRGRVASIPDIAKSLGYPQAASQLVEFIVTSDPEESLPWHRVVGEDGSLPGDTKSQKLLRASLLEEEGVEVAPGLRVDQTKFRWVPRSRGPVVSPR